MKLKWSLTNFVLAVIFAAFFILLLYAVVHSVIPSALKNAWLFIPIFVVVAFGNYVDLQKADEEYDWVHRFDKKKED